MTYTTIAVMLAGGKGWSVREQLAKFRLEMTHADFDPKMMLAA